MQRFQAQGTSDSEEEAAPKAFQGCKSNSNAKGKAKRLASESEEEEEEENNSSHGAGTSTDHDSEVNEKLKKLEVSSTTARKPEKKKPEPLSASILKKLKKDGKWSKNYVPLIGAHHDTSKANKAKIVEKGRLRAFKATDPDYDSVLASEDDAPAVVYLMATRTFYDKEWKYCDFALYPLAQRNDVKASSHRVEFRFDKHIKLHESRYELYFIMAHQPRGSSKTLQVHVAVWDANAKKAKEAKTFLAKHGVLLDKATNPILWIKDDEWRHHKEITLDGQLLAVWLNLCIAANVSVKGLTWTKKPSQAKHNSRKNK